MSRTILPVICLLVVLVLVTDCSFCLAQNVALDTPNAPETQWDNTYGPVEGHSIIQTSDGGYAVGGTYATYQSVTRGPGHFENYTAFLIKTDSSGTIQWNKTYELGNTVDSVIQTDDGGYTLSGYSENKFWLIKTDELGKVQWANTYLDPAYQTYSKVAMTKDGYFLVGYSHTQNGRIIGKSAAVIVKVDSNGNFQWNKTYNQNSRFLDYAETGDNGLTLLGISDYYDTNQRPLLMKIDDEGNVLWMKTYNDYKIEELYSLCATQDGGYFLAGSESASGNSDSYFALLVKTNSTGDLQWNKTFDPSIWNCDQVFRKIMPTNDNNYFVGGIVDSERVLLLKIDNSGDILWRRIFTYYDLNLIPALAVFHSLTGTNDNSLAFVGTKIGDSSFANCIWMVKLAPEIGIPTVTLMPTTTTAVNPISAALIWIIPPILIIAVLAVAILIIKRKKNRSL